jgi:hypothetical protein
MLVIVTHKHSTEWAQNEMQFWMQSDTFHGFVEASMRLTPQQVATTLWCLVPLVNKRRTHIEAPAEEHKNED